MCDLYVRLCSMFDSIHVWVERALCMEPYCNYIRDLYTTASVVVVYLYNATMCTVHSLQLVIYCHRVVRFALKHIIYSMRIRYVAGTSITLARALVAMCRSSEALIGKQLECKQSSSKHD